MAEIRLPQFNDVRLVGRLTRDPDLRYTPKGFPTCKMDLAVNRRYKDASGEWKDDPSFIPVVVWRDVAQRCGDRLKKGSPVYVEGRLKSRSWQTQDGKKRSVLEVEAWRVQFLAKTESSASSQGSAGRPPVTSDDETIGAGTVEDEEVPF